MWTRREVLAVPAVPALAAQTGSGQTARIPASAAQTWLGPDLWANRLQDWRVRDGWVECVEASELRTAMLLTSDLRAGRGAAALSVRIRRDGNRLGFSGFLIGGGAGELDWRAAALMLPPSGTNGGMLCVCGSGGALEFREHTDESRPLAYARLDADPAQTTPETDFELRLEIRPAGSGYELRLSHGNQTAVLAGVAEKDLLGSVGLVTYGVPASFRNFRLSGSKVHHDPARATGPILGAMHSLSGRVLKLTAQLFPVEASEARLEVRPGAGEAWRFAGAVPVDAGYTARFRVADWDSSRDWEYRVLAAGGEYAGTVRREPGTSRPLVIGLYSCNMPAVRTNRDTRPREFPDGEMLGRYTHKCIYFPHRPVVEAARERNPDLLLFTGDQIYQNVPTQTDAAPNPALDYLYKWYLWLWAFGELTRDTPCVVLVDDHDVYHGNIWGEGGRRAPEGDQNLGGYVRDADFVNLVQRTQTSHNPDPFDATPVEQGIGVYYCAFEFGGASFAVLEDRKFKTAPPRTGRRATGAVLLGARQEKFLERWALDRSKPKICVTQTVWACAHTTESGQPARDYDSNGYPKTARDRALRLIKKAGAILLCGDQHLGTLIRHGISVAGDGPVQFCAPATGTSFQRWFEPAGRAVTGDATDFFGNRFRMLAVANPRISYAAYRKVKPTGNGLYDKSMKRDGFGIVRVDFARRRYVIECWDDQGKSQHPGWPYTLGFDQV